MEITPRARILLKIQGTLTQLLFLAAVGLLAWLSTRYTVEGDWTHGGRHTLSPASQAALQRIGAAVQITAFARENLALRKGITELVRRYQRYRPEIALRFVNPDTDPKQARALGITREGTLLLAYRDRELQLTELNEQALTNALLRLARQPARTITFLSGHGERNPLGEANHDLGAFGAELQRKGLSVAQLNLSDTPAIPARSSALVIAGPQVNLLPGEVEIARRFVRTGGNLLWLADPDGWHGLEPLAADLGIQHLDGVVADPTIRELGVDNPAFAMVTRYPEHPLTKGFELLTLYPQSVALELTPPTERWTATPFLKTHEQAWTELDPITADSRFDAGRGERLGPLTIGVALQRSFPVPEGDMEEAAPTQQRIVVIGDGDFLANTYLGNAGNLELGLRLVNWLSQDDRLIEIPARTAPDTSLVLSERGMLAIGLGFLFVIPVALLAAGGSIWLIRRRR